MDVDPGKYPEDLLDLNPYHTTPTLIDRDLVLYDSRVIMEYLDERFPHPPLMPVDPVSRARARLALYQIEHDWYDLARKLDAQPATRTRRSCARNCATTCCRAPTCSSSSRFSCPMSSRWWMRPSRPSCGACRATNRPAAAGPAHPQVRRHDLFAPGVSDQPLGERAGDAAGMNDRARNSKRPYLIRAMHAWMMDNGETPHVIVDAEKPGVEVPRAYVKDGKVVLNLSSTATQLLVMGNDWIEFEARFAGVVHHVRIPVSTVLGIYARETGEGMVFSEQDLGPEPPNKPAPPEDGSQPSAAQSRQVVRAGVCCFMYADSLESRLVDRRGIGEVRDGGAEDRAPGRRQCRKSIHAPQLLAAFPCIAGDLSGRRSLPARSHLTRKAGPPRSLDHGKFARACLVSLPDILQVPSHFAQPQRRAAQRRPTPLHPYARKQ